MTDENSEKIFLDDSDPRARLAAERTLLAYERTQIAWIRTSLTLISFGFAISEFFTYLRQQQGERATVLSPRAVGLTMVVIALIGLTLAAWHHQRAVQLLRRRWPDLPAPRAYVMSGMIAFLGILVLVADLLR